MFKVSCLVSVHVFLVLWIVLDLQGRKSYVTVLVGQEVATGFNHL